MFRRILVPTDFTEKGNRVLDIAMGLAERSRGKVTLIHVVELIEHAAMDEFQGFYEKLRKRAAREMETLLSPHRGRDVEMDFVLRMGKRVQEVLRFAEESGTDLIVLGSHRIAPETPLEGWGTISYKVAILAACPVMIVK